MKTKTQHLTGPALDWAVAKCKGRENDGTWDENFSSNWLLGGPIIEQEKIDLTYRWEKYADRAWQWRASMGIAGMWWGSGPTPLIAAMRAFVFSRLGDTVEIPEELQ